MGETKAKINRRTLALTVSGLLAAGLAACSYSGSPNSAGATYGNATSNSNGNGNGAAGSGGVNQLVMESSPENAITQDFHPFVSTNPAFGMGATGLVYEPLIQFNLANPAQKPYDWLATGYSWSNGGRAITFTIPQNLKGKDRTPFTPGD